MEQPPVKFKYPSSVYILWPTHGFGGHRFTVRKYNACSGFKYACKDPAILNQSLSTEIEWRVYFAVAFGERLWTPKERMHISFADFMSFKRVKLRKFFRKV